MQFIHNDGGRAAAGFRGDAGDCVTRAIAIATGLPYREVYDALHDRIHAYAANHRDRTARRINAKRTKTPRDGVNRKVYEAYLASMGWRWVPCMAIGSGCKVHLADGELPMGRIIARLSHHLCAVVDGVIHDTHDPQWTTIICENGVQRIAHRCVYGYFVSGGDV